MALKARSLENRLHFLLIELDRCGGGSSGCLAKPKHGIQAIITSAIPRREVGVCFRKFIQVTDGGYLGPRWDFYYHSLQRFVQVRLGARSSAESLKAARLFVEIVAKVSCRMNVSSAQSRDFGGRCFGEFPLDLLAVLLPAGLAALRRKSRNSCGH